MHFTFDTTKNKDVSDPQCCTQMAFTEQRTTKEFLLDQRLPSSEHTNPLPIIHTE